MLLAVAVAAQAETGILEDVTLRTALGQFQLKDTVSYQGHGAVPLRYGRDDEACEVRVALRQAVAHLEIAGSSDFDVVDSLVALDPRHWSFKVRFDDLTGSELLKIRLRARLDSTRVQILEIPLFPVTTTTARLDSVVSGLHVGREKVLDIYTNNVGNIRPSLQWTQAEGFEYRVVPGDDRVFLHVLPTVSGRREGVVTLDLAHPDWKDGPGSSQLRLPVRFDIHKADIGFLRMDPASVTLDDKIGKDGVEVQIADDPTLQMGHTYVLEEKEKSGSPVVATLFVRERLANGQVLGLLRAFNSHRRANGFLYLKDGDVSRFLTNIDLLPRIRVDRVLVLKKGKDWEENAAVHPGETMQLRLEGQSLDQAKFGFGELVPSPEGAALTTENAYECRLQVPMNVARRAVPILDHGRPTGKALAVQEFEAARPFDFVQVDYGSGARRVSELNGPEVSWQAVRDVFLRFDRNRIDSMGLYGKQHLALDVRITGPEGNLVDVATISDLPICPGSGSPRAEFYDASDCHDGPYSIGDQLSTTLYDLEGWSKISLSLHDADGHYDKAQPPRRIDIILAKRYQFDVDVSFPVGLLVHKAGESGWGDFSGVSMAMMGKLGFYDRDKIDHLEPYELATGFIAMNAFDLNRDAADRDLAVVGLLTLNPVNTSRKLSFPIYFGGGYLISQGKWFWLLGPGVSVQF